MDVQQATHAGKDRRGRRIATLWTCLLIRSCVVALTNPLTNLSTPVDSNRPVPL
jgi:hypothetical protein